MNRKVKAPVSSFYLEHRKYQLPKKGDFINRRIDRALSELTDVDGWKTYYNASDTIMPISIKTLYQLSKILGKTTYDNEYQMDKFDKKMNCISYIFPPNEFFKQFDELYRRKRKMLLLHLSDDIKTVESYMTDSDAKLMELYQRYATKLYNRWMEFTSRYYGVTNSNQLSPDKSVTANSGWFNSFAAGATDVMYNFSMLLDIPGYDLKNFMRIVDKVNVDDIITPDDFLSTMNSFHKSKYTMILNQIPDDKLASFKKQMHAIDDRINRSYEKYICDIHDRIVQLNTKMP